MRAKLAHACATGKRVVLTVAVTFDRTATTADLERVKTALGGYRCDVDVTPAKTTEGK